MTSKNIIVTVSVIALALVGTSAFAGKGRGNGDGPSFKDGDAASERGEGRRGRGRHGRFGRGMGPGFHGKMLDRMAEELQLTETQKAAIEQIHEATRKDAESSRENVRALKEQMREEWTSEEPDKGTLLDLHEEIHEIKGELGESRIQTRLDVMNVLTPEQRATMKANMEKRMKDGRGRGSRGMKKGSRKGRDFKGEGNRRGRKLGRSASKTPQKLA